MNIQDFTQTVLSMKDESKTQQAIANLKHGLKYEEQWNDHHRKQVTTLVYFLESGDKDIRNISAYITN